MPNDFMVIGCMYKVCFTLTAHIHCTLKKYVLYDFWMDDNIMVKNCINKLRGKETKAIVV
jgi:hypothetical protein